MSTEFTLPSAEHLYRLRVQRAHRDAGYWMCVFLNGPREGAYHIMHHKDVVARVRADKARAAEAA